MKVQNIAIGLLRSNPSNPRDMSRDQDLDALASSIAQSGILVPLIVRKAKDEGGNFFEVLAGHRRLMAAEGVLDELPCVVTAEEQGDGIVLALIENTQRVDLSALETARAVAAAIKGGMKQKDLAAAIGRTPSYVSKMVKIMKAVAFLEAKGTDPAYMGDYTNYEELYEHAREVLGEVTPNNAQPKLPGVGDEGEEGGEGDQPPKSQHTDSLRSLIDGHAELAKVKLAERNASYDNAAYKEGKPTPVDVSIRFKSFEDAEKFFGSYGVSSSK